MHHVERLAPHLVQVLGRTLTVENRQIRTNPPRVVEGVVHDVEVLVVGGTAVDLTEKPVLLEVGDVPHVPHDRRHESVVLLVDVLVRERIDHPKRARPDLLQRLLQMWMPAIACSYSHGPCLQKTFSQMSNAAQPSGYFPFRNCLGEM